MRTPSEKHRIGGESLSEIKRALINEVHRLRDLELQATDRALEQAHLVSAYTWWCLNKPESERIAIAKEAIAAYRNLLELDEPASSGNGGADAKGLGGTTVSRRRQPKRTNNLAPDAHGPACIA